MYTVQYNEIKQEATFFSGLNLIFLIHRRAWICPPSHTQIYIIFSVFYKYQVEHSVIAIVGFSV